MHLSMSVKNLRRATLALALAGLTAAGTTAATVSSAATPAHQRPGHHWFTSWAESQQSQAGRTLDDQSVRMITHLSQGGSAVRIRIQNTFGSTPLTVDAATVAESGGDAALAGAAHRLTFGGHAKVVVPAGGQVWSDPARLATRPQDDVAVSLSVPGQVKPGEHGSAFRHNYLSPAGSGDHTKDAAGSAYTQTVDSTYLVSAVDVLNPKLKGTVVAFGSSVVDGNGSTNCGPGCTELGTNRRWTDDLARRVVAEAPAGGQVAVANEGIGGTTSAAGCPGMPSSVKGLDALSRLDRDVLQLHGVTGVIYYYGTNDVGDNCTAQQIMDSYKAVFKRLHAAGLKVYVTPVTPRPGYTDPQNRARYTVDTYVKKFGDCAGTCDGVIDFDQVLKDPVKPNSLLAAYDNGDGIHANIAGQQAIADYISLPLITPGR
ncbi:GDSL-type esterase/lipase family protein [Streptomyces sp. NRRL F-5126]|uniref:GDSL-type esterase/lipase family protein n=1 Tax=Streptomyces sp. NRRL F-5126 TaxID=1463857 RepID=UPI00068C8338|nr:GDSL-type esterase/lipase family protein [Streptomyces sp. NRRL F-5126]